MALTEAQKKALYESTKKQATTAIQNGAKTTDEIKTSMEQKQKDEKKQKEEKIKLEAVKSKAAKNKEQDLIGAKDANKLADEKARKEIRENRENNVSNSFSKARQFQTVSAKAVSSEAGKQPMSATQYGKTQLSNQIYDKYRAAEDYYNNPYGNSLEKGLVNRLRSAGGETVENVAYFLKDNLAPETGYTAGEPITLENRDAAKRAKLVSNPLNQFLYNNAQDVVAKNTAGQIGDLADRQIIAAKENTGDFGDALINIADAGANMASQAILSGVLLPGAPAPIANKVLSGVQGVSAGGQKYRDTREAGGSQQEAFQRGLGSATIATITEGLGGIGKTGVSKIPGVDKIVTHLDELGTKNFITNALATGLEEGGEEGLEYAFEYLSDVFADLIYKGEIETDFNLADLFMNVVSGFGIGAGFGSVAGTANAYQNYDPNAKNKPNNVETNTPAEQSVSPAEAPIAEAENVTPETANEQEGAFANVGEKVEAENENEVTEAPEKTLKTLKEQFDKGEISKEEYLAKNYENLSKYFEERKNANAQVNSTNDVVKPANDVVENANAQPRAQGDGGFGENTVGAAQSNPTSYAHLQNEHGVHEQGEEPVARDSNVPLKDAYGNRTSKATATIMDAKVTPDKLIPAFEKEVAAGTFANRGTTNKETVDNAAQKIASYKTLDEAVNDFRKVYSDDKILSKDDLVFGEILYSMTAEAGANDTAIELASMLVSNNSRTGDAMQAQRILKRLSPEGRLYHAQQIAGKFNKDKHQKNEIKLSEETIKKVLDAKTDEEIEAANDAVAEDIAKQIDKGVWDDLASMWNAWRYFSMLGNPKTHIRNMFGNLAFLPARKVKNLVKAGIENVAYKANWIDEKTASVKLASKENRDFAKESFKKNKKALLNGGNYRFESEVESKREPFRLSGEETETKKFFNAVLTPARKLVKGNSDLLEAEDILFLKNAYIDSLTQYLTANNLDANNLTEAQKTAAEDYAAKEAQKATYRDTSAIANALEKLSNTEISFKGRKIKFRPLVDAVVPFRKTPINVLARAVEYSPVGLATTLALDGKAVKNGDITANEMIDHISSGLTGSGIYALGIALALKGVLTGSEDEDKNEKEFAKLQGKQAYALKIGDGSYTLDWLAPTAIPLFLGAETVRVLKKEYSGDEKWGEVAWGIIKNLDKIANPMLEMSMLQNLDSFLGSNYSKDGNALSGLAQDLFASYVLQAVPTLLSQVAQTMDGTRRDAYYVDKTDNIPDEWQIPLQRAMAKIPGLSQKLPAYVDAWGRKQEQSDNVGVRILENFLSPGYYKKKTVTAADEVIKQLIADGGDWGVIPTKPEKSVTVKEVEYPLSAKEYEQISIEKGQKALELVSQLAVNKTYKGFNPEEQIKAVDNIYKYSGALAKEGIHEYELPKEWKKAQDAKKEGLAEETYLSLKPNIGVYNKEIEKLNYLIADKGTTDKEKVIAMKYLTDINMDKYEKFSKDPEDILMARKIYLEEDAKGGEGTTARIIKRIINDTGMTSSEDVAFMENVLGIKMSGYKEATKNDKEALDFYMAKADSSVNKEGDIAAFVKKGYSAEEALAKYNVGSGSKTYEGGKFKGFSDKQLVKANKVKAKGHSSSTIAKAASAVTSLGSYGTKKTYASYVKALEAVGITDKKFQQDFWNIYM